MHHFDHQDGHINYNSDLSGEVHIVNSRGEESWVSGAMLVSFVADYVRRERITQLESMSDKDLMGVACPGPTTLGGASRSSRGQSPTR